MIIWQYGKKYPNLQDLFGKALKPWQIWNPQPQERWKFDILQQSVIKDE